MNSKYSVLFVYVGEIGCSLTTHGVFPKKAIN